MASTPLRCPNCRKKQPEPCPTRCGCGQSLVAARARRGTGEAPHEAVAVPGRRAAGGVGPLAGAATGQLLDVGDNEW